jgi:hypothetical protein
MFKEASEKSYDFNNKAAKHTKTSAHIHKEGTSDKILFLTIPLSSHKINAAFFPKVYERYEKVRLMERHIRFSRCQNLFIRWGKINNPLNYVEYYE